MRWVNRCVYLCAVVLLTPTVLWSFDAGMAGFGLDLEGFTTSYRVLGIYVDPDRRVEINIRESDRSGLYSARASGGKLYQVGSYSWAWETPAAHGVHRIVIAKSDATDSIQLNAFVLIPRDQMVDGHLNGYRIGTYPEKPFKGLDNYLPPSGFVEVTPENARTPLSPHFVLEQFLCKQNGDWPKYVVLREELLLKLELLLQRTNDAGISCSSFHIMSGYRTPFYNASIGNVKYSRHQWGGAADIFVDEDPRDEMMDDLNQDGAIDWRDAAVLYDIVDEMYGEEDYEPFVGGLARYKKTANHGPFVHIDVRGFRARWGD